MTRVGLLQLVEVREVTAVDGRRGMLLQLGDMARLVIVHKDDGGADLTALAPSGESLHHWEFNPATMENLVTWACGPARLTDDEPADSLQFCSACFNGRCGDCKGSDTCECDHKGRNALAKDGPEPR